MTMTTRPSGDPAVIDKILRDVKLPSLPDAAIRMLELCRDPGVSAQEIVRVIELDPSLSARLLKVANSSFFGQSGKIETLTRAAILLGNDYLKAVGLGFFLTQTWKDVQPDGFDFREFWRDSILRACLARQIASKIDYHPREQVFLAGMLADIGSLVMGVTFEGDYATTMGRFVGADNDRKDYEQKHFGVNHVDLGKAIAQKWSFPESIVCAIARHQDTPPMRADRDRTIVLWQITHFCLTVPFAQDRQTAQVCSQLRQLAIISLGLSFESLSELFSETVEQFNVLASVFSNLLPADVNVSDMMNTATEMLREVDQQATQQLAQIESE